MTKLKVRARAVDMLGRQQIAGIPTAIHELFKNAHDAYAERAEVDFFRRNRVLVLRDDGYGMTLEDVENRWLTLGTESRLDANKDSEIAAWTGPKGLPRRAIMGEKGIGRLAIAVIAPITLMLTRAIRKDGLHPLVVALVHWGLFEQPGIDISEIDIPVIQIEGNSLPTRDDISNLADMISSNIQKISKGLSPSAKSELVKALELVKQISPEKIYENINAGNVEPLSLQGEGYGTHFILLPVGEELDDDIDSGKDKGVSKLEKYLLGFSNLLGPTKPVIALEFRDHKLEEDRQLIGPAQFFTKDEYTSADHHFEGRIDEYGQFVGIVSVYGKPHQFVCNWQEGKGRFTRCGPFEFKYAYVQGLTKDTRLEFGQWERLKDKLDRIGGLYIYRDGIRVLPYGNSDYDFLDIELRRSRSFKDWFFSYRRGFGYVALTHKDNDALSEKAGREGFRENQAYRDLQSILVNLFQQFAIEFFRDNSTQGSEYKEIKEELNKQNALLEKQKKKADGRRASFSDQLKQFFSDWEGGVFKESAMVIREKTMETIDRLTKSDERAETANALRLLEIDVRASIRQLNTKISIQLPRGLSLSKVIERDWVSYQKFAQRIRTEIIQPLEADVISQIVAAADDLLGARIRSDASIKMIDKQRENIIKELLGMRQEAMAANDLASQAVRTVLQEEITKIRSDIEIIIQDLTRGSAAKPDDSETLRAEAELRLDDLRNREASLLVSIQRQMLEIAESIKSRETTDDRFAALEQQNRTINEQLEFYSEYAQLGLAVGVLQHEFEKAARGFRSSMMTLKNWSGTNPKLGAIIQQLKQHFDHLDGYLRALDPLGRKLANAPAQLSGEEILNAVRRVFEDPIQKNDIKILATKSFRAILLECKSSAMISAFINIIDNAIYWLTTRPSNEHWILLNAKDGEMLISNSGPGIEERIKDQIFEFGETTKPGGRGMGLAVSREALRREGFALELITTGREVEPIFRIAPLEVGNAN